MAHFLSSYDYEPEYMAEEIEARSKAAVRPISRGCARAAVLTKSRSVCK